MENGSFQAKLENIDFANSMAKGSDEDEDFSFHPQGKPAQGPQYSSSIDALLRQNEDLAARLKITTQRLIQFEASYEQINEKNQQLTKLHNNYQDQLLIWKEKERLWLEKLEIADQKNIELENRYPKIKAMEAEIQRYVKYHDKVKTHVKPYIQQLKDYSNGLVNEVRELHRELQGQAHTIQRSQNQATEYQKRINELSEELKMQLRAHEQTERTNKINQDAEIKSFQSQLRIFKEANIVLESKAQKVEQLLARQDELDNLVIEHKRRLEESVQHHEQESEGLKQSLQMARNDLTKKNLLLESYQEKEAKTQVDQTRSSNEIKILNEQLSSLRFLWTEKSSEVEQLKSSLEALEKINRELSQKLAYSRSEQDSQQQPSAGD